MARLGMKRKTVHSATHDKTVEHKHVPGRAYEIDNPSVKLMNMIGGGFFNEPKYYDSNRSVVAFMDELRRTGKISGVIVDKDGLSEQAREVIETAHAIANGDSPEDLLIIAAWARDPKIGLKLRTTPQILLAIAAANRKTKPFVRRYVTSIVQRPDDALQVFAAYCHFFGGEVNAKKTLPASLRKGLAEAIHNFGLYQILKYSGSKNPTFKDLLSMIERKRDWPLHKSVVDYLSKNVVAEDAPALIRKRDEFFKSNETTGFTVEQFKEAGLTWENVLSKLGSSRSTWELVIPIMGEMALTRNLRNFEQACISKQAWDIVYEKLSKVEDTKQLPFRFIAADKEVTSTESKGIIAIQLDKSCENVPDLPGVTVCLVDNSGSAVGATISQKSNLRVSDCGNTLSAIIAKRFGRRAIIGVFGDSAIWVPFNPQDSCLSIKNRIDSVAQVEDRHKNGALAFSQFLRGHGVGGGTETGLWWAIDDLTKRKVHVDRFILLSDLCCYTQDDINCGVNMNVFGLEGKKATMQSMFARYRQHVNPNAQVYSVNLAGYGQSQVSTKDKNNHILSGWSEKIFDIISEAEGRKNTGAKAEIPALDAIREKFSKRLDT